MTTSINKEALIKGKFNPEQAREIVNTLFRSKIHMHSLSSFSSLIRTGNESKEDTTRKKELIASLERLNEHLNMIQEADVLVQLDCVVQMKLIKPIKRRK